MEYRSRIDSLTDEEKSKMAEYAKKWIEIGLRTGETDWDTFDKYMPIAYEKAGLKYPKNVVRVQSPLVGALAASVAEGILKMRRGAVRDAVRGAVGGAVDGAVDGAVRDAVDDAVRGAVGGAVDGAVRGAVGDAVRGAVRDAVGDAVGGAVRDAVRGTVGGAVDGAVDGAVRGAVGDAVRGAVGGAVGDAVRDAVDGAVRGAVRGAVDGAVDGAVRDAVDDAVRGAVGGAVDGAVRDAVGDAVGGAVDGAVGGAVGDAVRDAVQTAISIAKKVETYLSWHYWLGGQFWVGYWWYGVAAVNFLFDVCKLKLSQDIMERAEAYRKINESVNYIWPNSDFVMVCARPTKINRDTEGRLHCENGMAIQYPDGWGLYLLHGIRFDETLFKKVTSGEMPFEDILAIEDIDQRTQAMKFGNPKKFLKHVKAKKLDERIKFTPDGMQVNYGLYEIPAGEIFTETAYYLLYDCPSTNREYMSGVIKCDTVASAMAWKFGTDEKTWENLQPLVNES